ncbi:hypothetical protein, partial [Brevibacillus formosus]|uniref:hypothetical protein n=1 Tax=Brevibacillus formosus TaxID=54913 RepID=UPI003F194FAF
MFIYNEKVENGREDYFIIVGVGVISELPINFETWLDRIILSQGVNVNQNVDHRAHQKIDHHGKNYSTR